MTLDYLVLCGSPLVGLTRAGGACAGGFLLVPAGAAGAGALLGLVHGGPVRHALRAAGTALAFLFAIYLVSDAAARILVWRRRRRGAHRTAAVRRTRPAARREERDLP